MKLLNFAENMLKDTVIYFRGKKLRFKYFHEGEHNYIPDFYIPEQNLVVEIKGRYDEETKDIVDAKAQAVKDADYQFLLITDIKEYEEFVISRIEDFEIIVEQIKDLWRREKKIFEYKF